MTRLILLGALLTISLTTFAASGGKIGNGGDICEDKIKIIRDDIRSWILQGGSKGLELPEDISLKDYNKLMLASFNAIINCSDEKIFIGSAEKTCKNFEDENGYNSIQCNFERFNKTTMDDQYKLVHHEYAGISGFEVNNDEESDYRISNQIMAFLDYHVVKKLSILKPISIPDSTSISPASTGGGLFFDVNSIAKCFRYELSKRTNQEIPENYQVLDYSSFYANHITRGAYGEIAFNFGFLDSQPVESAIESMHKIFLHQFADKSFRLEEDDLNIISFNVMAARINGRFYSYVTTKANAVVIAAVSTSFNVSPDSVVLLEKIKKVQLDKEFFKNLDIELRKYAPGFYVNNEGTVLTEEVKKTISTAKRYLEIRDILLVHIFWPHLLEASAHLVDTKAACE